MNAVPLIIETSVETTLSDITYKAGRDYSLTLMMPNAESKKFYYWESWEKGHFNLCVVKQGVSVLVKTETFWYFWASGTNRRKFFLMKSKLLFIKKWSCFYGPKLESSITSVALHEPKICQMVKVTKFCVESCSEEKSKLPPTSLAVEVKMRCDYCKS